MNLFIWPILTSAFYSFPVATFEPNRIERDGAIVVCEEPVHDFGTVWVGDELCHTFVLRNEGSETAYLRAVSSSMSMSIVIEPNSEHPLPDCMNSRKLNGPFEKLWTVALLPSPFAQREQAKQVERITSVSSLGNNETTEKGGHVQQEVVLVPVDAATATYGGVTLVCENPIFDIGTIWVNQTVRHEYVICNVGTDTGRVCIHWHGYGPYSFSYPKTETILPGGVLRIPFAWTYHRGREYTEGDVFTLTILPAEDDVTRCHRCGREFEAYYHQALCKYQRSGR